MNWLERQLGIRDSENKPRRSWSVSDVVIVIVVGWILFSLLYLVFFGDN
jgi:hypothetical protein